MKLEKEQNNPKMSRIMEFIKNRNQQNRNGKNRENLKIQGC